MNEPSDRVPELMIVMPVYNEQASVMKVVTEWFLELESRGVDFVFLIINDGSTDNTPGILTSLAGRFGSRIEVITHSNRGHGQSCLCGYRIARERCIPYVFQIDSDGQCDPRYFFTFWQLRANYDVIYGRRTRRNDGWRRAFATWVLKITLLILFRVKCADSNVPYRLIRTGALNDVIDRIPSSFFLANVALAFLMRKDPGVREFSIPITFLERYGGEPVIGLQRFGSKAVELIAQLNDLK